MDWTSPAARVINNYSESPIGRLLGDGRISTTLGALFFVSSEQCGPARKRQRRERRYKPKAGS